MAHIGWEADIRKLGSAWQEIQRAGGVSHPMYSWEWVSTWWEVFGEGRRLQAFVARKGGEAVAIAPFACREARMNRLFGVTMAERGVSQLVSVDLEGAERLRDAS